MADTPQSSDNQTQAQEKYWKPKKQAGESHSKYLSRYYTAQRNYAQEINDKTTSAAIDAKLPAAKRRGDVPNKEETDSRQIDATMLAAGGAAGAAKGLIKGGMDAAEGAAKGAFSSLAKRAGARRTASSAEKAVASGAKKTEASAAHPSRQPLKSEEVPKMPRKVSGKPTKSRNDSPARMRSWESSKTSVKKPGASEPEVPKMGKPMKAPKAPKAPKAGKPVTSVAKSAPRSKPAAREKTSAAKPSGAAAKPAKAAAEKPAEAAPARKPPRAFQHELPPKGRPKPGQKPSNAKYSKRFSDVTGPRKTMAKTTVKGKPDIGKPKRAPKPEPSKKETPQKNAPKSAPKHPSKAKLSAKERIKEDLRKRGKLKE